MIESLERINETLKRCEHEIEKFKGHGDKIISCLDRAIETTNELTSKSTEATNELKNKD